MEESIESSSGLQGRSFTRVREKSATSTGCGKTALETNRSHLIPSITLSEFHPTDAGLLPRCRKPAIRRVRRRSSFRLAEKSHSWLAETVVRSVSALAPEFKRPRFRGALTANPYSSHYSTLASEPDVSSCCPTGLTFLWMCFGPRGSRRKRTSQPILVQG